MLVDLVFFSLSCFEPLCLRDLINANCYLTENTHHAECRPKRYN